MMISTSTSIAVALVAALAGCGAKQPPVVHHANAAVLVIPSSVPAGRSALDAAADAAPVTTRTIALPSQEGSTSFQAALINGLSQFVVARGKAEILAYVTNEIGTKLCNDHDGWDVRSYFPDTCGLLVGKDGVEGFTPRQLGGVFRSALARDAARFLPIALNAGQELLLDASASLAAQREAIAVLFDLVQSYNRGQDPLVTLIAAADALRCTGAPDEDSPLCVFELVATVLRSVLVSTSDDAPDWRFVSDDHDRKLLIDAAGAHLVAALAADDALGAWVKAHRLDPQALVTAFIEHRELLGAVAELATAVVERAATDRPASWVPDGVIRSTFTLLRAAVKAAGDVPAARELVDRFAAAWHEINEWVSVGRVVLAVIEGLWHGDDPLQLTMDTVAVLPCVEEQDVGCALQMIGRGVRALVQVRRTLAAAPSADELAAFVDLSAAELVRAIEAEVGSAQLAGWYKTHLGSAEWRTRQTAMLRNLWGWILRIEALRDAATEPADRDLSLLELTLDLWRVGIAAAVPTAEQQRVLAILDEIEEARIAAGAGDVGTVLVAAYSVARHLGVDEPFPPQFRKYMPFVVDILSSKDGADVRAALEKFAEPVGGWRNKREQAQLSLNAFLGITTGREYVDAGDAWQVGGFIPVGFDLSYDRYGVFASLVDLGAVTTVTLDGENTDVVDPSFEQILAPGLYGRIALFGPFVGGIGASLIRGRDLEVTPPTKAAGDSFDWRVHAFVGVDVTLFQLYARQ